jgi:hypothetical protein
MERVHEDLMLIDELAYRVGAARDAADHGKVLEILNSQF